MAEGPATHFADGGCSTGCTSPVADRWPATTRRRFDLSAIDTAKKRSVLPGFGLTLGFTLLYFCLLVLIPLAALFLKTVTVELGTVLGDALPIHGPSRRIVSVWDSLGERPV